MAAEEMMSMESTVDMMAARGPAMKTPAQKGDSSFTVMVGTARSPTSIPGRTALPRAPTRCMVSMRNPTTKVPMIIPLFMDRASRKPRHFWVVWGRPSTARPTSTQKERMKGLGMAFPGPVGVSSAGSVSRRTAMIFSMPPPAFTTAHSRATEAQIMTHPWMVSVTTTARKPPTVV